MSSEWRIERTEDSKLRVVVTNVNKTVSVSVILDLDWNRPCPCCGEVQRIEARVKRHDSTANYIEIRNQPMCASCRALSPQERATLETKGVE
jgi:hypothetical protein